MILYELFPAWWAKWGVLLVMVVSLYANFATDFGAVDASKAAEQTEVTIEQANTVNINEK